MKRKKFSQKSYTVKIIILTMITLLLIIKEANAIAPDRAWTEVNIQYFEGNNLQVEVIVIAEGDYLKGGLWIQEILSAGNPTVIKGTYVIEATYSRDLNITKFRFIVSTEKHHGFFPCDWWSVQITFYTNIPSDFDPRTKFCYTPSPNYYGEYNTTFIGQENGNSYYTTRINLRHPPYFPYFITLIYGLPIVSLYLIAIFCLFHLYKKRKKIKNLVSTLIPIVTAVIVSIPVLLLALQNLKTPFTVTAFDAFFIILLLIYLTIICIILWTKATEQKRIETIQDENKLGEPRSTENSEIQRRVSDRFVDLIDIIFGVVVATNIATLFRDDLLETWSSPIETSILPIISLLVAYFAIILSWVGYHRMIEVNPYTLNRWGYSRFSIDLAIVFVYATLIYSIANFTVFLVMFPIMFFLYMLGGLVRIYEYGRGVSWPKGSMEYTVKFSLNLIIWLIWEPLAANFPILKLIPIPFVLIILTVIYLLRYRLRRSKKGFIE